VIEINQTRAEAGGVTAADLPGFPVTIASPGSYRLTGELAPPGDTAAIEVLADDVALELGGFALRGVKPCTGTPPQLACPAGFGRGITGSASGTRVSGGVVTGFADGGIQLGDSATVSDIVSRRNGRVGISVGERSRIANSQATNNGGVGFSAGAATLVTESSSVGNRDQGAVLGTGSLTYDSLLLDGQGGFDPGSCIVNTFEPNDSEVSSHSLGTVSDTDANGSSLASELAGSGDADWFSFSIADAIGGTPDPAVTLTVGGSLQLCLFYSCDVGTTVLECPVGSTAATSTAGRLGCCRSGGSLQLTPDCALAFDDSGTALFRVSGGPAGECTAYQLDWHP
jgi:hypothetical protein